MDVQFPFRRADLPQTPGGCNPPLCVIHAACDTTSRHLKKNLKKDLKRSNNGSRLLGKSSRVPVFLRIGGLQKETKAVI